MQRSVPGRSALAVSLLLILTANIASAPRSGPQRQQQVKIFFSNPKLPAYENDCGAGEFVTRKLVPTKQVAHAALKLLFAGPTTEEKAKGMESLSPLGDYYLGVRIRKGVAIVNFRRGAEEHLRVNGPLCMQDMVLAPIVETLKQFGTIKSVAYAINGKIIEDWDV